ncbi:MAG: hypothetical protein R2857_05735 [Vampirovibrionales bacterium]
MKPQPDGLQHSAHSLVGLVDYVHQVGGRQGAGLPWPSLLKLNAVELVDKRDDSRQGPVGDRLVCLRLTAWIPTTWCSRGPKMEKTSFAPHRALPAGQPSTDQEVLAMVNNPFESQGDQDTNYEVLYEIQHKLVAVDEALIVLSKPPAVAH